MQWRQFRKAVFYPFDLFLVNEGYTFGMEKEFGWGHRNVLYYYRDGYDVSYRAEKDLRALRQVLAKKLNPRFAAVIEKISRKRTNQLSRPTKAAFASKKNLIRLLPKFYSDMAAIFSVFQLPDYAQFLLPQTDRKLLVRFGLARDYAARIMVQNERIYRPRLGVLLGLPAREALMLLPDEVLEAARTGVIPRDLSRRKHFLMRVIGGKLTVLWNTKADAAYRKEISKTTVVKILRGQAAYPGSISGKVYVAFNDEQFRHIPNGAILVCSITRYDVVPYLKRVAAIVTDQGGITCHTAIIAREMKIPAVIGTRIASDVLKTGDRVEVDATNGTVRKF